MRNESTEASRSLTNFNYTPSLASGTLLELANGDFVIGGGPSNNKFIFHMQYWDNSADGLILAPILNGSYEWDRSMRLYNDGRLRNSVELGSDIVFESYSSESGNQGEFFKVFGNGNLESTSLKSNSLPGNDAIVVENASSNLIDFKVKGNGYVYAREIEVTLGSFPDYVFDDNYNLMDLSELRKYIDKEKHLPGVKSAVEVSEEGIGLGELSKLQMVKIEELILYILQQQDMIKQLESRIDKLEVN
ncbi:MAG: hypothetical protein DWP98_12505 [Bacteroidetes bacterium]|nr:MAG: hypothetical protein DWP98_12505 [Bacteroidota bacterium]MBL1145181.1 hypothetical protein [Bacteroidota bacterium]NOG57977.1 hypothetical protein [Bacteroidota bacterium]